MPAENRSRCLIGLLACIMTTCAAGISQPPQAGGSLTPEGFPEAHYRMAKEMGKEILRVDPARSLVVIKVRRGGPVAWLGHDHVIASHNLNGFISLTEGRADLYVPLEQLVVDEPGLRSKAGFDTQPFREDIEATRRNMQEKTLVSERFPFALIHATRTDTHQTGLNVSITLHGITRTFEVQAETESIPDGITVSGKMSFNQSDFGITPLSVLGGLIQVQDNLDIQFRIHAQKAEFRE